MALITRPALRLSRDKWRKPNGAASIDWTHPNARGLIFQPYDPGDGGPMIDLVSGSVATKSGSFKPSVTRWGQSSQYDGTGNHTFAAIPPLLYSHVKANKPWTLCVAHTNSSSFTATDRVAQWTNGIGVLGVLWHSSGPLSRVSLITNQGGGQEFTILNGGAWNGKPTLYTGLTITFLYYDPTLQSGSGDFAGSAWFNGINTDNAFVNGSTGPGLWAGKLLSGAPNTLRTGDLSASQTYTIGGDPAILGFQGQVPFVATWNRVIDVREQERIVWDMYGHLATAADEMPALFLPAGGSTFTLSSVQGSYTLTGKPQTLTSARSISSVQGSYALTGQAQTLNRGRPITAAQGAYTVTGKPQTLNRGITSSATQGSYTVSGQAQTLTVGLPATQGSYAVTGKPQSFAVALSSVEVKGNYAVTGFPQVLSYTQFGAVSSPLGGKFIADVGNMTARTY